MELTEHRIQHYVRNQDSTIYSVCCFSETKEMKIGFDLKHFIFLHLGKDLHTSFGHLPRSLLSANAALRVAGKNINRACKRLRPS